MIFSFMNLHWVRRFPSEPCLIAEGQDEQDVLAQAKACWDKTLSSYQDDVDDVKCY